LFQQHWSDLFIDIGIVIEGIEFRLHALVLLLLRFELLARVDEAIEFCR
jgi:hypothetical protein